MINHYFIYLKQIFCLKYRKYILTFVNVVRSLSLSGSPFSCRVLRLLELVKHSLRALHSMYVMSLERMAGITFLKLAL